MRSELDRRVCAGAPLDASGKPRESINGCPFPPAWACMGIYPGPDDEPVNLLLLACPLHMAPIMDVVSRWDPEHCLRVEMAGLPQLLDMLAGDYWTFVREEAA